LKRAKRAGRTLARQRGALQKGGVPEGKKNHQGRKGRRKGKKQCRGLCHVRAGGGERVGSAVGEGDSDREAVKIEWGGGVSREEARLSSAKKGSYLSCPGGESKTQREKKGVGLLSSQGKKTMRIRFAGGRERNIAPGGGKGIEKGGKKGEQLD